MKASISSVASVLSVALFLSAQPSQAEPQLLIVKRGPYFGNLHSVLLNNTSASANNFYITGVSLFYEQQNSTLTARWGGCLPGPELVPQGLNFTPNLLRFYY